MSNNIGTTYLFYIKIINTFRTHNGINTSSPITVPGTDLAVPEKSRIMATPTAIKIAVTFSANHGTKYTLLFWNKS